MISTCGRGPGPPQVGPGPPRAYPDTRELSAQLAAREVSGTATCHTDAGAGAGAGTSLPLEAPSPTASSASGLGVLCCFWARGSFCQSTLWIASYRGGSSVTEARSSVSALHAWATSHDDQLLTGPLFSP